MVYYVTHGATINIQDVVSTIFRFNLISSNTNRKTFAVSLVRIDL